MITLHPLVLSVQNGKARLSCDITDASTKRTLWFEVDEKHKDALTTDVMDAFVVGCLLPAMNSGQDMEIKGAMSTKLFYNIKHYLIPILKIYLPVSKSITLKPDSFFAAKTRASGVITGFSGGIDSFCNYYDHTGDRAPHDYHVTHFVYNNVGSHGQGGSEEDKAIFAKRFALLNECVVAEGKPFIMVDSNLDDIVGMNFLRSHAFRNCTVPLLLQNIASKFLYASSFAFKDTAIRFAPGTGALEPVILPLLSTERLDCIGSGAQYSRVEKTMRVAELEISKSYLDVCVQPHNAILPYINCSYCWKCLRTQLTLSLIGKLNQYGKVFDISIFPQLKNLYLLECLTSREPLSIEVADFIRAGGLKVLRSVRLLAIITPKSLTCKISGWLIPRILRRKRLLGIVNKVLEF